MERIRLDMQPKGMPSVCHASQYDEGRVIGFDLVDGLQGFKLNGDETIELEVRKPDNNIVTAAVTNTSSTYIDIVTTEQMTACEGDSECEIRIKKDGVNIGSGNFILRVEEDPLKGGIESETEIHNLETQIQAINDVIVPAMIADQYDSANVIFDDTPTENHGIGYAVTSEGIKNAIDAMNPAASAVNYDNTDSGLTATNAQDAIDEVNDKADTNATNIGDLSDLTTTNNDSLVDAVNEVAKQILYADVSIGNVSIGANGYADISNNANIPAIPTGYKVLFAVMTNFGSLSSKNGGVTIFTPHQGEYWVGSVANDSITGLEIRIVYIKN